MKKNLIAIAGMAFLGLAYCNSAMAELRAFNESSLDKWDYSYDGETYIPSNQTNSGDISDKFTVYEKYEVVKGAGSKYGWLDQTGKIVIKAKFGATYGFTDGLAAASFGDYGDRLWGVINNKGEWVVEPKYDETAVQVWRGSDIFVDGRYQKGKIWMYNYIQKEGSWKTKYHRYTINKQGKVISDKIYDSWTDVLDDYIKSNH